MCKNNRSCLRCKCITYSHNQPTTTSNHTRQWATPLHSTRSDDRERHHHHHHRPRRHLKVLRQRERRSSSLKLARLLRRPDFPSSSSSSAIPRKRSWSSFHRRGFGGWQTQIYDLSHEGRWQYLRTTSCQLSEVSDSLRGSRFASASSTPFFWRTG